ncbi:MAG TPA: hypothetical protein VF718_12980 [Allosphingosinicella sp.]|jgi:hypothetical protein
MPTFDQVRSELSKRIIFEQIASVSEGFYKDKPLEFDEDNFNWLVFPDFMLPPRWSHIARTSPLLISFPMEYPTLPPVGFYLSAALPSSPNGHLYPDVYHSANQSPTEKNWAWYCVYIDAVNWNPSVYRRPGDWRDGDNLWDYITLINESLQSVD